MHDQQLAVHVLLLRQRRSEYAWKKLKMASPLVKEHLYKVLVIGEFGVGKLFWGIPLALTLVKLICCVGLVCRKGTYVCVVAVARNQPPPSPVSNSPLLVFGAFDPQTSVIRRYTEGREYVASPNSPSPFTHLIHGVCSCDLGSCLGRPGLFQPQVTSLPTIS